MSDSPSSAVAASDPDPAPASGTVDAEVTPGLNALLANATVFYQKVRHYHWNVTGPHFFTLHETFEALYDYWNDAIDELAEQVRSRGDRPVHTLADVLDLASLDEDASTPPADEMVRTVTKDLDALDAQAQRLLAQAEAAGASGTATVLSDLSERINDDRWMLRAWLNEL